MARMSALLAGLPVDVPGRHRQPAVRLGAAGGGGRRPGHRHRRGRPGRRRRGRVDVPRAAGDGQGRARRFPRGDVTAHDTTLGWRFVNPRMQALWGTDPLGETAEKVAEQVQGHRARPRTPSPCAASSAGRPPRRPGQLRGGDRAGGGARAAKGPARARSTSTSTRAPRPPPAELAKLKPGVPQARAPSPPATPRASTTAPPPCCWPPSEGLRRLGGPTPLARYVGVGGGRGRAVVHGHRARSRPPASCWLAPDCGAGDLDLVELNEAFAAQALPCIARAGPGSRPGQRQRRGHRPRPPARLPRARAC